MIVASVVRLASEANAAARVSAARGMGCIALGTLWDFGSLTSERYKKMKARGRRCRWIHWGRLFIKSRAGRARRRALWCLRPHDEVGGNYKLASAVAGVCGDRFRGRFAIYVFSAVLYSISSTPYLRGKRLASESGATSTSSTAAALPDHADHAARGWRLASPIWYRRGRCT